MSCNNVVPSCAEVGLRACKSGNYQFARQMLQTAMSQLEGEDEDVEKSSRLIELTTDMADTYLIEGNFDLAKGWYLKALSHCELLQQANTWRSAGLMARLAEVHALNKDMSESQKYMDKLMHAYLLALDDNISSFLNPLIDLSWCLCVTGHVAEAQPVNDLIAQIRSLEHEDRLSISAA
jgi:tetratricopeptide (TPR) repeat protein